jgi:hypothetical protein
MSIYKTYTPDQVDNLLSNFLITSWSYSKLSQFARHEKAFEMRYIYNIKGKSSASSVAGTAYHEALKAYFNDKKAGTTLELPDLERIAFGYIEDFPANYWKLQKTTPTVEDSRQKAYKDATALLNNFCGEIGTYIDEIKEIVDVEVYCDEWLSINGVDIPMPCHGQIDLVVQLNNGKLAIIDHKSKTKFSDEEELKLSIGIQAITYVNLYEAKTGYEIDEVWFVENKISTNRDGSAQLNNFKIKIDKDVRRLYEALLYEPLKRMLEAVQNPDYVYLINESDNFIDKSEIYEFWAKTMMAEVEEFDIAPSKKELIQKRLKKIRDASVAAINPKVIKEFQKNAAEFIQYDLSNKDMTQEQKIEHILRSFGIIVKVAYKFDGYSSNTYLLEVSAGVKITSVHSHKLDIANALDVSAVRITSDLVVHNGKSYVSIEFAKKREKDLIFDPSALQGMRIPLGKDNYDNTIIWDLDNHSTPHVLICGATGSGKSVSIKSTIEYAKHARVDKIVIFDPKYEFTEYEGSGVEVYNEILEIETQMANLVEDMNNLVKSGKKQKTLIVFDEFADAVAMSRKGAELKTFEMVETGCYANGNPKMSLKNTGEMKSLEENLRVLLQKGRSTGFRIISATQRASVKVITGDAKVNFPVQICFRVPKEADSRVVLDEAGAESLAGAGDALIKSPEYKDTVRFQAYYKPSKELVTV